MSRAQDATRATDAEIAEELALHIRRLEEDLIARGMTPAEAAAAARAKFGNVDRVREECAAIVFWEARIKARLHLALTITLAIALCGTLTFTAVRARAAQIAQREAVAQAELARQAAELSRRDVERANTKSERPPL